MWIIYAYGHLILSNKFLGEKIIRMKVKVIFYASLLMLCSCVKEKETAIMVKNGFERAEQQLSAQLQTIPLGRNHTEHTNFKPGKRIE